jgi:hypothetical protein
MLQFRWRNFNSDIREELILIRYKIARHSENVQWMQGFNVAFVGKYTSFDIAQLEPSNCSMAVTTTVWLAKLLLAPPREGLPCSMEQNLRLANNQSSTVIEVIFRIAGVQSRKLNSDVTIRVGTLCRV